MNLKKQGEQGGKRIQADIVEPARTQQLAMPF